MTLFETISRVQPALPGWCSAEKAEVLASLVVGLRPALSLEIGVFGGSSFIPIALAHKHINHGVALGIDPWDVDAATRNEVEANVRWANEQDWDGIYNKFLVRISQFGLSDWVDVRRQRSDDFYPTAAIGLLHVDGSHTEQAIRDVRRFSPKVSVGGVCVLDDLDWENGNVRLAEQALLQSGFTQLYPIGTGAVYQRIR